MIEAQQAPSRARATLALVAAASVVAAFALAAVATFPNLSWYGTLAKPSFTPPDWLFGPAWTILYVLLAVAFYRVLATPPGTFGRGAALILYAIQITLNAAWSWAFFAAHNPPFGLAVIMALDAAALVTLLLFARVDRTAGACFLPYLAWLGYATALNAAILALNS